MILPVHIQQKVNELYAGLNKEKLVSKREQLTMKYKTSQAVNKSVFESSSWKLEKHDYTSGNHLKTPPYLVEVEIMMLDSEESFKKWQEADTAAKKKEVFAEFGYTFRRAVLLGKK